MVKKTKYAAGIEIESAFGRTDYMYVYEVAPWAYDAINDWIKVAIQGVVDVDITDDWARQLGQVDLARYKGAACGLLNPVHVGITVAGAIVDPRQIRALTAADIVSAAQSGVWSVGRTWALAIATDSVVAQVSNWPALYAMNLTQYLSAAVGLLNPVHVGVTVAGAIVDPRSIRALTAADIVTADSLSKWAGTALTGHDITDHITNVDVLLSTRARLQPWYQTNFNTVKQSYGGGSIAPHAATVRWTYTVPANRIAKCTNAFVEIMRVTAPVAAGRVTNVIRFAAAPVAAIVQVKETTATVGVQNRLNVGESSMLVALEAVNAVTQDLSNGGAYDYVSDATFIEFDT